MKNMRFYREQRNMTQVELSEEVGTTKSLICAYETGARSPQVNTALAIAHALGVTLNDLVGEKS